MTERENQLPAGVPGLIDQYKQRRQAWLAQADELVRLREEVRSAAEQEALEIVTAARRDVRRIVVEARRNLLVLTAQLHASIESVDQASLQAAAETASGDAHGQAAAHALTGQGSLGETPELVLGARREVRTVLDEARLEIEALAAEAHAPLREVSAALGGPVHHEGPIPTLETILGADPLTARGAGAGPLPTVDLEQLPIDSMSRSDADDDHDDGPGGSGGQPTRTWLPSSEARATFATVVEPFAGGTSTNLALAAPVSAPVMSSGLVTIAAVATMPAVAPALIEHAFEEPAPFIVTPSGSPLPFSGFHATEESLADALAAFEQSGPVRAIESGRTFFADYEEGARSRPAWMWVGLFAATGIVAVVGTVWWFTLRDSSTALATSVVGGTESPRAAAITPASNRIGTTPAPAAGPAGLAIEVRRTAWIRTVVDGKEESRVYQAGETRQIVGARAVSIRAGDGGAVFVSLDGRPAEALGGSGLAVTRQYSLASAPETALAAAPAAVPPAVEPLAARPPEPAVEARPLPANAAARPAEPPRANTQSAAAPVAPPAGPAAPPAADAAPAAPAGGGRADLIAAGNQWLDAYQRRDRDAMSSSGTENMTISDERSVTERFPAWQAGVRRDLDQLELELSGDTALLTARMTERSADGSSTAAQHVSRVSQIWVRRSGRWRLADVRIIGEARLNQIVR